MKPECQRSPEGSNILKARKPAGERYGVGEGGDRDRIVEEVIESEPLRLFNFAVTNEICSTPREIDNLGTQ